MERQTKPFLVYRSSAGSGKTRSLSKEYLKLALVFKSDYFKHILAVTFTNKATHEMKDRILNYLIRFSSGVPDELGAELKKELQLDDRTFVDQCQEALSLILHNYSQFSISTIDAFFQRVIRSFTREAGLMGNFRLEVDHDQVLEEVVKRLLDDLGKDRDLTEWVVKFSRDRLKEGSNWNITYALVGFAKEFLKEDFKQIEKQIMKEGSPSAVKAIHKILVTDLERFKDHLKGPATQAVTILKKNGISSADFKYGESGTAWKFFHEWARGVMCEPGKRIQDASFEWAKKESGNRLLLIKLTEGELKPILFDMMDYYNSQWLRIQSVELVIKNFYMFGLITDMLTKLTEYKTENNLMLIADSSQFLNGIIDNSDTPFIYEKAGSFFKHYLIDEFQDTSVLQWKNFKPLLEDGLDQQQKSMVVGDVKQSVYRWRGSDLTLLQSGVIKQIGKERTYLTELRTNYRSAGAIVDFNNKFFKQASHRLLELTGSEQAKQAYEDVEQAGDRLINEGFVHFRFFENWKDEGREKARNLLAEWVEKLQAEGVRPGDIAILVRKNEEGQEIAHYFLQYKDSALAKPGCRYDVVSSDSLRLDSALSVSLLLAAFRFVANPRDWVALGEFTIARSIYHGMVIDSESLLSRSFLDDNPLHAGAALHLSSLPIEEVTEHLIRMLEMGSDTTELTYLQAFQDVVLEFSAFEKNDVASFLDWWELNKTKKSVQSSSRTDAINIITIHKAKGLQFKYVIVPFCDWSLNHENMRGPILWCRSVHPPFDQIGYAAIRYEGAMKNSFFAEDYQKEYGKVFLDNLNLLYVAFTRAEDGLIVMGPENKAGTDPSLIGQLACESIRYSAELNSLMDEAIKVWEKGSIAMFQDKSKTLPDDEVILQQYVSVDWRKKLVIKTLGAEFFQTGKSAKREKINYGILLHQVLSRIHYKSDVDDVIHQVHVEGIIVETETIKLREIISELVQHPIAGNWFSKEWTVKTEAPLLVPAGKTGRIDRVIFKETPHGKKKAVIIDYKSGDKKSEDREQVQTYARLLSQMGYADVEAYLVYLMPLEVVPVLSKMNLNLF